MKFDKKYISGKFAFIIAIVVLMVLGIVFCMVKTMTFDKSHWMDIKTKAFQRDSVILKPTRGNILSADGQLLASSLPDYKLYIDFMSGLSKEAINGGKEKFSKADSAIYNYKNALFNGIPQTDGEQDPQFFVQTLDTICNGLSSICPKYTSQQYREMLAKGWKEQKRYFEICPHTVLNYLQYKDIMQLPFFREAQHRKYFVGLTIEERNNRKKPFGSLAKRTLGEMFGAKDEARSGLELAFDSLLRGEPGLCHRQKVRNRTIDIIDKEPVNGCDLITTIDITMQDICENALREGIRNAEKAANVDMGVVVLMEVKTGDVKGIVNLTKYDDGKFYEARNFALAALMEPGSTFKTASILVGLDDGEIKPSDHIDGSSGIFMMYGAKMKDHNWARGGYHDMDVAHTLMHSSNIGVSRLIDNHYHNKPEKFVEGLHRVGIGMDLHLPFVGSAVPNIRMPKADRSNWSKTALAWMSIGYETQIPPISTCTFYNAIANKGKLVQPRFVLSAQHNGKTVKEFPVTVLNEQIAKPECIDTIQSMLLRVVDEGVGKPVRSKFFKIAGKTGTAQISTGSGYGTGHLVSFCGFFPAENPQYTCMVAIRVPSGPSGGASTAGPVFKKIAETIYAKAVTSDLSRAKDSLSVLVPNVKKGNISSARKVLKSLNIASKGAETNDNETGTAHINGSSIEFNTYDSDFEHIPDLIGMGARDAIYELERRGVKARVEGMGTVVSQSLPAGTKTEKGQNVRLVLEIDKEKRI